MSVFWSGLGQGLRHRTGWRHYRAALPLLEERKAAPRMQSHLAQIFHTKIVGGKKAANIFVDNIRGR